MTILDNELPDNLLGSTSTMKFTLDDDGYCKCQKDFNTCGS
jgi:hypothetical protein